MVEADRHFFEGGVHRQNHMLLSRLLCIFLALGPARAGTSIGLGDVCGASVLQVTDPLPSAKRIGRRELGGRNLHGMAPGR